MTYLRRSQVSAPRRDVLNVLARLQYATAAQVAYWVDRSQSAIYELLASLEQSGFVTRHKALQPHIFTLKRKAYRLTDTPTPKGSRIESWSVMSHRCHRNLAEIRLRQHYASFQFNSRRELYRYGVNPAHGEHFGVTDDDHRIFMLLDDYLFDSTRITHAWQRSHTPNRLYFDQKNRIHRWSELATHFVIAATDAAQYETHKRYIAKHHLEEAAMMKIEAIW